MKVKIVFPVIVLLILSSCVSKKKFVSMQDQYIAKTDSLVVVTNDLNAQLAYGEVDFESTKHDLMISDAVKNDQISSLEIELKELQSSFDEVTATLDDTKNRYKATQSEKDQVSYQMVRMNKELVTLRQDTVSLNYALKLEQRKFDNLQKSLNEQNSKLSSQLTSERKESLELKKAQETSRLKTMELERQLAIKQKQIDGISDAFVELRKELLRAKTSGTIIDPNTNSSVSKIAKSLGQY